MSFGHSTLPTPGLDRLIELQREGGFLFHGDRRPGPVAALYPAVNQTSYEPERTRGFWIPRIGLIPPYPLVTYVFPSPVAAAIAAMTQNRDGVLNFRCEPFDDGAVTAVTFGEGLRNEGAYRRALRNAQAVHPGEVSGEHFVNVVPRHFFDEDRMGFPVPGVYVAPHEVPVKLRVALSSGDLRALSELVGPEPCWIDSASTIRADPFTGLFATGGQLQFDTWTGERILPLRTPTDADRQEALRWFERTTMVWLKRVGMPSIGNVDPTALEAAHTFTRRWGGRVHAALPVSWAKSFIASSNNDGPRDGFTRALQYLDQHCTREVTGKELAQVAGVSRSQLYAMFQARLGRTPAAYVTDRRLDLAERLLTQSRMSVSEVAERCGFKEPSSLTRSLKRRRGVSPRDLRKAGSDPGARGDAAVEPAPCQSRPSALS